MQWISKAIMISVGFIFLLPIFSQIPWVYNLNYTIVKNFLKNTETIQITDTWRHEDTTLEGFGFKIHTNNGKDIFINFYENNNWLKIFFTSDGVAIEDIHKQTLFISNKKLLELGIDAYNVKSTIDSLEAIMELRKEEQHFDHFEKNTENYIYFSE